MSIHRQIAQMMRAAAGPPPDSPFPWVHKWDFTAESGGSIPDLMGGASLTLSGSYTPSTAGVRPTASNAGASVPRSSLGIDIGFGSVDTYTVLVAAADMYSVGVGNTGGRYFDGFQSSTEIGQRIYIDGILTRLTYQQADSSSIYDVTVPDISGKPSSVAVNSGGAAKFWVSGSSVITGPVAARTVFTTADLIFMNRRSYDRAGDGMFVGGGIISQILTDQEYIDAVAELLAL